MKVKLAFLAQWPELAELVKQVAYKNGESVEIFENLDCDQMSEESCQKQGIEAIIARGPSVDIIRKKVSIPVINCEPTAFDLIKAFSEASQFDSRILFINSWRMIFDQKSIEKDFNLGLSIQTSDCYCEEDIYREVELASNIGLKVVVGGTITYKAAPKYGMKCIKLFASKESIAESFKKAKEAIRVIQEKQVEMERLRIILNTDKDGIISIDGQKKVTLFNAMAEEMTGIDEETIIGKSIDNFPFLKPIRDVLQSKESIHEEIITLGNAKVVNNRVPILVKNKVVGVVSTYQDITKLQETEIKVRKELNKKGFTAKSSLDKLVGNSKNFKKVITAAEAYAKKDSTILILGETGCGKGLLAQGIHLASNRRNGPFVSVNCSALPENLLESELFGYEEGAFTGARRGGKQGLFELAHNGTLFLDEIAGTSMHMQSRLLKVVEEMEVMRVGGVQVIPLDVRIIAASNKDLRTEIRQGRFRSDLFYRLNVLSLKLPPLRERKEDICLLFCHFLKSRGLTHREITAIVDKEFSSELENYCWPGNVRELEHFAEKTAALCQGGSTDVIHDIRKTILGELHELQGITCEFDATQGLHISMGTLEEMENEIIRLLYRKYYGNKTKLAEQLDISRTTLWKKLDNILNDVILSDDDILK